MTHPLKTALKDASLLADKTFVGGRWVPAADGRTFAVTDPFDRSPIADVPSLSREEVAAAGGRADAMFHGILDQGLQDQAWNIPS